MHQAPAHAAPRRAPRAAAAAARPVPGAAGWAVVLVPVVVVLVGAWVYRWVDEDAFIDFRVVVNLVHGAGPVFNPGERVEVYSDPLWVATLTVLHEVIRFVSLEWLSVLLGLLCTAAGVVLGGRAVQRLGASRGEGVVVPVGLVVFAVVPGVWEFVTSGLEMGMVFLWMGLFLWLLVRLLVRSEAEPARPGWAAFVAGLGPLIRPELVLVAAVDIVAVLVVIGLGTRGGRPGWGRYLGALAAALALPVVYELFRTAYFGLLVPNTGLAKGAGTAWWSQGFTYLWNLLAPYTLWFPLLVAAAVATPTYVRWWRGRDAGALVVMGATLLGGLLDLLYVARIGGDYMHARLALPGFFAVCLVLWVGSRRLGVLRPAKGISTASTASTASTVRMVSTARMVSVLGVGAVAVWAVACAGWLRYVPPKGSFSASVVFISNERDNWVKATGVAHPITAAQYSRALSGQAGAFLRRTAARVPRGRRRILVVTNPYAPLDAGAARPARSSLPFRLVVNVPAIGVIGYLSGPQVYLFDEFSLANPIGSHTVPTHRGRPGHEKPIGPAWMIGRFGIPGEQLPPGSPLPAEVAAARRAIGCQPLHGYLEAITSPMGFGRAWSDLWHSFGWTTMSFSPDPQVAERQLCG